MFDRQVLIVRRSIDCRRTLIEIFFFKSCYCFNKNLTVRIDLRSDCIFSCVDVTIHGGYAVSSGRSLY